MPRFHQLRPSIAIAARGVSLFLGGVTLLNLLDRLRDHGFDGNLWWIDLRALPAGIAHPLLAVAGLCLLAFGAGVTNRWCRRAELGITTGLLGVVLANVITYYHLRATGALFSGPPLPFSVLLAAGLALIVVTLVMRWQAGAGRAGRALIAVMATVCAVGFPAAQIYSFGLTDYRRPADAIVVFGAMAFTNTQPSAALADRVRTACALYRGGYAPMLLVSGGPARRSGTEAQAMRHLALDLGVPDAAIVLDEHGLSTHDTVGNTSRMLAAMRARRVIAVSHFFHLPRIKMSYQRAGVDVYTVPVSHPRMPHRQFPFMVLRETAALWTYYLRGS